MPVSSAPRRRPALALSSPVLRLLAAVVAALVFGLASQIPDAAANRRARVVGKKKNGRFEVKPATLSGSLREAANGFRARNPKLAKIFDQKRAELLKKAEKRGLDKDGKVVKSKKRQKKDAKIRKRFARLNEHIRNSTGPMTLNGRTRKTVIVVDGADGAGKSSTIEWISLAFQGARPIKTDRIGASDVAATDRVQALIDDLPEGGVLILDRYAGDAVFDSNGKPRVSDGETDMEIAKYNRFEQALTGEVDFIKFHLDVSFDRQAKTFVKRENLNPSKLSENDYAAIDPGVQHVHRRRMDYVMERSAIPWKSVKMDDRPTGRGKIAEHLERHFGFEG